LPPCQVRVTVSGLGVAGFNDGPMEQGPHSGEHMDKVKVRMVRNIVAAIVFVLGGMLAATMFQEPWLLLGGLLGGLFMAAGSPLEPGDAVLALVSGEWAPAWIVGVRGDVVCVAFDASWGKGMIHVPKQDIVLL